MIKAIVFDVWNTLAYNQGPNPFVYLREKYGITDIKLIEKAVMTEDFKTDKELIDAFCRYFRLEPAPEAMSEMLEGFRQGLKTAKLFDDVIPTLKNLRKTYRLGIISNTDSISVQSLKKQGLFDNIQAQCLSCDVGLIKPDPEIFQLMLEKLDLKPGEVLMIGDNIDDDLIPASELGLATVLIRRPTKAALSHHEGGVYPRTITSLKEIGKYLK